MRRSAARVLGLGLLLAFVLPAAAQAQFGGFVDPNVQQRPRRPGEPLRDGERAFGDSTATEDEAPAVQRRVRRIWPLNFRYSDRYQDSVFVTLAGYPRFDEVDTLPGFTQTLGLMGKPYLRYLYGIPTDLLYTGLYHDPLSGRENVYILDPYTQLPHYDTRTPYVNTEFHQAPGNQQLLRFDISQNITAFWNATLFYRRRSGNGEFLNSVYDHYNIAFSNYFRSFDRRLGFTLSASFNQTRDQISGGLAEGGLVSDSLLAEEAATVVLQSNQLYRRVRNVTGIGTWRLLGDTTNNLTVVAGASYNHHQYRWEDPGSRFPFAVVVPSIRNRAYANVLRDSLPGIRHEYTAYTRRAHGGLRFSARVWRFWLRHQVEAEYEGNTFFSDSLGIGVLGQTKSTLRYVAQTEDTARVQTFRLGWRAEYRVNNLMANEVYLGAQAQWAIGRRNYVLADSLWREVRTRWVKRAVYYPGVYVPLRFDVQGLLHNRNPSVQDRFWQASTFEGNPALENETLLHLRGGLRYTFPPGIRGGVPFLPAYVGASVFLSRRTQPIFYDRTGRPQQLGSGGFLQWQGLQVQARGRLWRLYLEGEATAQRSTSNADAELLNYVANQPQVYGRASLYFENKVFRQGNTFVHAGIDAWFFSEFLPLYYDPSVDHFYPQRPQTRLPGYVRLDAVVSANIISAIAFVKVQNLNAGLTAPNYVTTPWYPNLTQAFVWGVTWKFYD